MSSHANARWPTLVAGLGSPHGDDQAGWLAAALVARHADLPARVVTLGDPLRLWDLLPGVGRLVLIDACRSGGVRGAVVRLSWPSAQIKSVRRCSSHGLSVNDILEIGAALQELPREIEFFGIEAGADSPGAAPGREVTRGAAEASQAIVAALREARDA